MDRRQFLRSAFGAVGLAYVAPIAALVPGPVRADPLDGYEPVEYADGVVWERKPSPFSGYYRKKVAEMRRAHQKRLETALLEPVWLTSDHGFTYSDPRADTDMRIANGK